MSEQPHTSPQNLIRAVRLSCVKCGVLHAVQLACLHDWEAQSHMVPVTGGKVLQQKKGKRRAATVLVGLCCGTCHSSHPS